MTSTDVVIVGCGPAGMSAALFLSEMGIGVTAIDRLDGGGYDRYHGVCGAGISDAAIRELGLRTDKVLNKVGHTIIEWPDGSTLRMRTPGCILDRPAFLADMRGKCERRGVVFVKCRVTDVSEGIVKTSDGRSFSGRYIIGADGAFSAVRAAVFGTRPAKMLPASETLSDKRPDAEMRFRIDPSTGGYSWVFPRGAGTCEGAAEKGHGPGRYLPFGGVGAVVKGNVMLLGDAAGMANPVSFAGLRAALTSGKMAAEAIRRDDPQRYARWWDSSILSDARFMEFHRRLVGMSEEELAEMARPFRNGHIYISGLGCVIRHPENRVMYFGCLQAFRHSW